MANRRMTLAAREARLAYWMLAPTFAVILAIVLFPVLLNVWISFKSVTLADLRAPVPVANERVLETPSAEGDPLVLRLTMRNGSQRVRLENVVWTKTLPAGLELATAEPRCTQAAGNVRCRFGDWDAGYRETLELTFTAGAAYFAAGSPDVREAATDMRARAENVLTNLVFTLDNYRRVLTGTDFWPSLWITLGYTFFSAIGSIALGLFAAMLLNGEFRGRGLLRGLFLFPYVAPVIAVAFVWAFFLDPFSGTVNALGQRWDLMAGPVNFLGQRTLDLQLLGMTFAFPLALATVVVFSSWNYFPFAFLFILARLQAVPIDMYEAADVDGAGPFQKFWFITLPNLAGVLAVLFLLRFMFLINKFEDIFLLTGGAAGTKNLPVMIYDEAFARADIGAGSAVAMILFVILLGFMFVYYRFAPESEK
ncbi:MAG: carbohydrate ABC transporter permease [Trueperaceae bacterium]